MEIMTKDVYNLSIYFDKLSELGYGNLNYDALWKWASILDFFYSTNFKNAKILDIGGGHSPISFILDKEHDITNIDINFSDAWFPLNIGFGDIRNSKIKIIESNFFNACKNFENQTFDVIIDGCSIIHFDTNKENLNRGLQRALEEIKRLLKPEGCFIICSDSLYPEPPINIENSGEMLYPEQLYNTITKNGFSLISKLKLVPDNFKNLKYENEYPSSQKINYLDHSEGWINRRTNQKLTISKGLFKNSI
jgi:SAM-dependent methyltransferase